MPNVSARLIYDTGCSNRACQSAAVHTAWLARFHIALIKNGDLARSLGSKEGIKINHVMHKILQEAAYPSCSRAVTTGDLL